MSWRHHRWAHPLVHTTNVCVCVCVCVGRIQTYLGGHQDRWVCQLVVAVHPEGEKDDGCDRHDGHQRVEEGVKQLRLLGKRVGGCWGEEEKKGGKYYDLKA